MMSRNEPIPSPDDFKVTRDIPVRFRDLDAMGHVNNAVYISYFEVGREAYMQALGHCADASVPMHEQFPFILLDISCRFLSAAQISETVRVHIRVADMGTKSFVFEYLLTSVDDGRCIAVGRSTGVHYDYATSKATPLPADLIESMKKLDDR